MLVPFFKVVEYNNLTESEKSNKNYVQNRNFQKYNKRFHVFSFVLC